MYIKTWMIAAWVRIGFAYKGAIELSLRDAYDHRYSREDLTDPV